MRQHKLLVLFASLLLTAALLIPLTSKSPIAHAAAINACPPSQSQGASGTWVQVIQFKLDNVGYKLATDGSFGPQTEAAVVSWQKAMGLWPSGAGVVGNRTWSTLNLCPGYVHEHINGGGGTTCPPTLSNGSSGIWVQALEDILNYDYAGFMPYSHTYPDSFTPYLASDGSFGTQTYHAVVDFQYTYGLSDDGIVGPNTWRALYMCH